MNESYEFISNDDDTNMTNWNDSYKNEVQMMLELYDKLRIYFIVTLMIAGTLGNSLVCLAIYLDRKLQNLRNYFLLSLAISDLLFSIIILPIRILAKYAWVPSRFPLCFLLGIGETFLSAASTINICFMSLDRYLAIKNPLNQRNPRKRAITVKIGMVWFLAFLATIPYIAYAIITDHLSSCSVSVAFFIEAVVLTVTVVVIVVSFILTSISLQGSVKRQGKSAKRSSGLVRHIGGKISDDKPNYKKSRQVLQPERKALRVVWLVSFAFIICMVPNICVRLYFLLTQEPSEFHLLIVHYLTVYLYICNFTIIDPIIYLIFSKTFRNNFKNIILCRLKKIN